MRVKVKILLPSAVLYRVVLYDHKILHTLKEIRNAYSFICNLLNISFMISIIYGKVNILIKILTLNYFQCVLFSERMYYCFESWLFIFI